jgi:hypothetical protein
MISIVVYGRNDNHGYNLHRRAALSLNCLAETLGDPDDELIFVDYNTPDELPTFPEAIQDTLSLQTKSKLRVLRVRPQFHRQFHTRTSLAVLEPIARNVAVRRSNPSNRWILSTNTDVILVLRKAETLSDLTRNLPSGHYHTARFGIPEALWETFDRQNAPQTIADVKALGVAARLNEVVYASDLVLYDTPGDFQLFERQELVDINGFNEEMILGWHVDSNITKRLSLKMGRVSSLIDEVFCYHCDHVRTATVYHKVNRAENDWDRFVEHVVAPELDAQEGRWGLPDEPVEEIRLSAANQVRFRSALHLSVRELEGSFSEASYTPRTRGDYHYDALHTLPFLTSVLYHHPQHTRLAWSGVRSDVLAKFAAAWRELGFANPIMVEEASIAPGSGAATDGMRVVQQREWLNDADIFAFEFGRASDDGSEHSESQKATALSGRDLDALAAVRSTFFAAVRHERARIRSSEGSLPRLCIGINCINNDAERWFHDEIDVVLSPYYSHVRHGFVTVSDTQLGPTAFRRLVGKALARDRPISIGELSTALDIFDPLLQGREIDGDLPYRVGVNALLGRAFFEVINGIDPTRLPFDQLGDLLDRIEQLRPSNQIASQLAVPVDSALVPRATDRSISHCVAGEDWDDPSWLRFAEPYLKSADEAADIPRDQEWWERIHLLYGLDRAGKLTEATRVLIVATRPDPIIGVLSRLAGKATVLPLGAANTQAATQSRTHWSSKSAFRDDRLNILDRSFTLDRLPVGAFDAVVFLHGTICRSGPIGTAEWLSAAQPLVGPGAVLAFTVDIASQAEHGTGDEPVTGLFDFSLSAPSGLPALLKSLTGCRVIDGFDPRLSRSTVDRIWPKAGPRSDEAYFLKRSGDQILVPGCWFLDVHGSTPTRGWNRLQERLQSRHLGEQIRRLRIGDAGRRNDDGSVTVVHGISGDVFIGPYVPALAGRYCATVVMNKPAESDPPWYAALSLEIVLNQQPLDTVAFTEASLTEGRLTSEFEVPRGPDAATIPVLQLRVRSSGSFSRVFTSVDLRRIAADPPVRGADNATEDVNVAGVDGEGRPGDGSGFVIVDGARMAASVRPLSRLVTFEDWDDPSWSRFLDPHRATPVSTADTFRDSGEWERAHILYGLDRVGKLTLDTTALVVVTMPDTVLGSLSQILGRVDVLDLAETATGGGAAGRLYWSDGALYAPDRLRILERTGRAGIEQGEYDVVLFPHGSMFLEGSINATSLMAMAEGVLKSDGMLVFKAEIAGRALHPHGLHIGQVRADGLARLIARATSLELEDGLDARLSRATFDRRCPADGADPSERYLLPPADHRSIAPSLWFLRKRGPMSQDGWHVVRQWMLGHWLGDRRDDVEVGPAGRRDRDGQIVAVKGRKGIFFRALYPALPPGRYVVTAEFEGGPAKGAVELSVIAAGKRLSQRSLRFGRGGRATAKLDFTGFERSGDIALRGRCDGAEVTFLGCRLSQVGG